MTTLDPDQGWGMGPRMLSNWDRNAEVLRHRLEFAESALREIASGGYDLNQQIAIAYFTRVDG